MAMVMLCFVFYCGLYSVFKVCVVGGAVMAMVMLMVSFVFFYCAWYSVLKFCMAGGAFMAMVMLMMSCVFFSLWLVLRLQVLRRGWCCHGHGHGAFCFFPKDAVYVVEGVCKL